MIRRSRRGERGAAATELTLLVPVVVLLLGIMVGGSRVWLARGAVQEAASAAARAASLARTPTEAEVAARRSLEASFTGSWFRCDDRTTVVDTSQFARPVGVPAEVTVRVTCTVPLSDLGVPGMAGALTADATGSSALDTYRARR